MELAAASTAASAALSAILGDAATPISVKLADLSGSFLIVLSAIYLEKYLVTITGYASFGVLIPLACGLFILNVFLKKMSIQTILYKIKEESNKTNGIFSGIMFNSNISFMILCMVTYKMPLLCYSNH